MPLQPGEKLGIYEILALSGTPNGSELYTAADAERTVVMQVFPNGFSRRFGPVAPAIAALKHPHICEIHQIGHQDGVDFLVLEHADGQTLAERMEGGKQLGVREAMNIALEIAESLDAAHRAGLAHRHLTPSNILLTDQGGVKLLEFGSPEGAPAAEPEQPASPPESPLGGPAKPVWSPADSADLQYTAPEQFDGREPAKEPDARGDVFSFGAILYEMLTGAKAFEGKSRAALIATLATAAPDPLREHRPEAPAAIEHLVERCVEKDPDERLHTHDLLIQLKWIGEGGKTLEDRGPSRLGSKTVRIALAAAALLIAGLAYPAAMYFRGTSDGRFELRVPTVGLSSSDIALSPDGQIIALVLKPNTSEAASLYVRRVGGLAFQKLGGTDDSAQPFFSADSRYIGFVAAGRLKKVSVSGGAPQDLAEASSFSGGAWSADGTILFGTPKGVYRVSDQGGKTSPVTAVDGKETGHYWPSFLPDGKHFLYLAWSAEAASRAVYVGQLDSKEKTRLMSAESNAAYAAPGYIVFHREGSLFAQQFNPSQRALSSEQAHVADLVSASPANGRGNFDVSQNGSLIYVQGGSATAGSGRADTLANARYGFLDRRGGGVTPTGDQGPYGDFELSPDGKLVAVTRQESGSGADIWVIDWQREGVAHQVTLDPADDIGPVFSPDSKRISFTSYRKGNGDIYVKNADGTGPETPLLESPIDEIVKDWSKDGKFIAYLSRQENFYDIYALPMEGDKPGKPAPVIQGKYQKGEPQFSYDGKWLAYTSNESGGRTEVFITPFPAADRKLQVSREGGGQPRWKADANELYFRAPDNRVMVVKLTLGATLNATPPTSLITGGYRVNIRSMDPNRHQLSVTPDGQRFLTMVPPGTNAGAGIAGVPAAPPAFVGGGGRGGRGGGATPASAGNPSSSLTVVERFTAGIGKGSK